MGISLGDILLMAGIVYFFYTLWAVVEVYKL